MTESAPTVDDQVDIETFSTTNGTIIESHTRPDGNAALEDMIKEGTGERTTVGLTTWQFSGSDHARIAAAVHGLANATMQDGDYFPNGYGILDLVPETDDESAEDSSMIVVCASSSTPVAEVTAVAAKIMTTVNSRLEALQSPVRLPIPAYQ